MSPICMSLVSFSFFSLGIFSWFKPVLGKCFENSDILIKYHLGYHS
jgi:hypothetical protein